MKRPLSPAPSGEKEPPTTAPSECPPHSPESSKPKRERKRPSYTLCDVCNIQLNSAAQAQVHCGGRAHQRRLRQLSLGKTSTGPGPASSAPSPLLASLTLPARPLQPQLDLKHMLAFHLNGAAPLSLFPNFSTMDPVQKAVISHTFGVPSPLKKKLFISCNICHLRFNSANQAEAHYKGHRHARKLKAVEAAKSKQRPRNLTTNGTVLSSASPPATGRSPETPQSKGQCKPPHMSLVPADSASPSLQLPPTLDPSPGDPAHSELSDAAASSSSSSSSCPPCSPDPSREAPGPEPAEVAVGSGGNGEGRGEKGRLYCSTCKVTVNSASQLQAHNTGAKHRWMVEGHQGAPRRGRGRPVSRGGTGHKTKRVMGNRGGRQGPSPPFHCALCQLHVNSETQLKQHMNSRRHKDRLAGKPPKPSSQHSKLQKHTALAVSVLKSKLALQKQLTKTLAARFLPGALPTTAAAICALPGPLTLRPAATAAATLFPAPVLGPALFRSPAGAVRPATGPILFAPY
ncbi:zinc finger protein 385C isoform X2 [Apodemus sylvaticus]|uniref:zinc finger protein 385C isoform X2 n=1 Tax=Apodemus sylvaticus TaxID=10129 RepID=UPI00224281A8|nr:zinc finger protein 385C isoform X2 [Apodemus sylvaticus]